MEWLELIEPELEVFEKHEVVRVDQEYFGNSKVIVTEYMTEEQFLERFSEQEIQIGENLFFLTKLKARYEKHGNAYIKIEGVGL